MKEVLVRLSEGDNYLQWMTCDGNSVEEQEYAANWFRRWDRERDQAVRIRQIRDAAMLTLW